MRLKKIIGLIHLWLGLSSGLVVLFLGITGCILAFQLEIESVTKPYQYVKEKGEKLLPPSVIKPIAEKEVPGKHPHSVNYQEGKAAQVFFYGEGYFHIVYINPYTGAVQRTVDMSRDFFRIVIAGHYNLWLPVSIGQPIVATATLVFFVMMVTGIILWWPKNKAARRQRFSIKWTVRWRRKNYDLHNVLGFYMSWVSIFIAITGLVMGFQWFAKAMYYGTSGGKTMKTYYEALSRKIPVADSSIPAVDAVYGKMLALYPGAGLIEIHYPQSDSASIEGAANPNPGTYWKTDYRYFDRYSLKEITVDHIYGRFENTSAADKIVRMNYDVHVGAIGGLATKCLAFFASLIAASLPVTGFLIWWGRRKKKKNTAP
ncbi:PepSY-associated TM helix domain-containing protein [Sediminibacterium soli]|uniref:PepSY-associated TM helix domain-containing protein n=1 Tax=Sediminibacterium soli TaxID=2698829 RepID=UPI00137AF8EE|nr:PepSY-associated TM helix domain-containing protein [Sediminibacterium soli]NCI46532.1 PepSY domain-containing protein [Sediminibacterium soli]